MATETIDRHVACIVYLVACNSKKRINTKRIGCVFSIFRDTRYMLRDTRFAGRPHTCQEHLRFCGCGGRLLLITP